MFECNPSPCSDERGPSGRSCVDRRDNHSAPKLTHTHTHTHRERAIFFSSTSPYLSRSMLFGYLQRDKNRQGERQTRSIRASLCVCVCVCVCVFRCRCSCQWSSRNAESCSWTPAARTGCARRRPSVADEAEESDAQGHVRDDADVVPVGGRTRYARRGGSARE